MIRDAVVAGQFYPGSQKALLKEVESLIDTRAKKEDVLGAVSPHAGYIYSGMVAGSTLGCIKPKSTYIILGPNHTGMGERFGLSASESWRTPLGEALIDKALAEKICASSRYIKYDDLSNISEHSIEVQLPFLQVLQKKFTFVPLIISHAELETYREIGREIVRVIKEFRLEKETVLIASSDMTHYEPQDTASKKDRQAIDAILELDEAKLARVIEDADVSMCGHAPASIMLTAAKELGAKTARLVKYQTSGNVSGDYSSVVGYAGIIIK